MAAPAQAGWQDAVRRVKDYAASRAGVVSFALLPPEGRERGLRRNAGWYSASLLKPVVLGAYLRQASVRGRALNSGERALLAAMIQASADPPANELVPQLGPPALEALGHRLGLSPFDVTLPIWGSSHITAQGYAQFFRALPDAIPSGHRLYARHLLRNVVASQRWGVGAVDSKGWDLLFKGGWRAGRGSGRIVNQAARLECGDRVLAAVVLTDHDPSHDYGTDTVRGVMRRLLQPLKRCADQVRVSDHRLSLTTHAYRTSRRPRSSTG